MKKRFDQPIPSLFWAAGFSFSHASLVEDVPYDPYMKYLFFGEVLADHFTLNGRRHLQVKHH